jgi:hypothetical protein
MGVVWRCGRRVERNIGPAQGLTFVHWPRVLRLQARASPFKRAGESKDEGIEGDREQRARHDQIESLGWQQAQRKS